jgi:hypothetical protein
LKLPDHARSIRHMLAAQVRSEQRAAERKANGVRLTYAQWRAEVMGE